MFDSLLLGGALGLFLVAMSFKTFTVSVPEVTGLLTVNTLSNGEPIPYGPGLHVRYPWEQVKEGNFINLRLITKRKTETYPSKDGSLLLVDWSYQYRTRVDLLPIYITVDEETIEGGLTDVGSSILSANIAEKNADDCKAEQQEFEQELWEEFCEMKPTPEELYGVELVRVSLADMDYEASVQGVRASEAVTQRLLLIAAAIKEDNPGIGDEAAMSMALVINGNMQKRVQAVEGEAGNALAALLASMGGGGK